MTKCTQNQCRWISSLLVTQCSKLASSEKKKRIATTFNKTYTNILQSIRLREVQQRDSRRILIVSVGGAILIPLLFFLIRKRRKNKFTL